MRYTRLPRGSTAAASCLNTPMAGWLTGLRRPVGSHSQTSPASTSSQDSQVPQGVPAAGAVLGRSVEDPVRVGHLAAAVEADRRGAARERLRVRHEDPAAVVEREGRRRRPRPRASGSRCPPPRSPPCATTREREALRQPQAQLVRRARGARSPGRGGAARRTRSRRGRPRTRLPAPRRPRRPRPPRSPLDGCAPFPARVPARARQARERPETIV